jgi:antitoxin component of MazEF toxin-antitoxin module
MIKQIKKVGNSNALILDSAILELLGLDEDSEVQLTIQDGLPHCHSNPPQTDRQKEV